MDHIEKVKQEYTDKYVVVDAARPELARFKDQVGQVKTVNMSGRALVEFMDYHLNIGWYDIDLDFLKVVEKPAPKPVETKKSSPAKKPAKKAPPKSAGGEKLSPLELARMQGAAKKEGASKGSGGKPSTADILAAARGKGGAAPTADSGSGAGAKSGGKMSTSDILAAARGKGVGASGGGAAEADSSSASAPAAETSPEPAAEASTGTSTGIGAAPSAGGKVDRTAMSVDEMLAMCRERDAS